jgi:hypothetical protein
MKLWVDLVHGVHVITASDGRRRVEYRKPEPMLTRLRQVLVVLVVAGTVFVVWNAVDAQSALPFPPKPGGSGAVDEFLQKRWTDAYGQAHDLAVFRIWERAAKVELAVLAGGLCVWLVLPRAAKYGLS